MNAFRHFVVLCLLGARLLAAPPADLPPGVFHVLTLVPADGLLMDGPRHTVRPIIVSSNRPSPPIPVPPGGNIEFYRLVPAPDPAQPPLREIALRAVVPAAPGTDSLLVLLSLKGPPDPAVLRGPLRALIIDSSAAAHPPGWMRVFNFSGREAALHLAGVTSQIHPGGSVLVRLPDSARPWLSTAILGAGGWQRVSGGPLTLRPGFRLALFMVDLPPVGNDPRSPGVSLFRIIDRPPPSP